MKHRLMMIILMLKTSGDKCRRWRRFWNVEREGNCGKVDYKDGEAFRKMSHDVDDLTYFGCLSQSDEIKHC